MLINSWMLWTLPLRITEQQVIQAYLQLKKTSIKFSLKVDENGILNEEELKDYLSEKYGDLNEDDILHSCKTISDFVGTICKLADEQVGGL